MQARKKSFVAGMQQTQGLARTASQMFFKQEKTERPVTKRTIFWVSLLVFLGYFAGALAIVILFFKGTPTTSANYAQAFNATIAPPVNWGTKDGVPCPFGGCTQSPTPSTKSPTSRAPSKTPTASPTPTGI